MNEKRPWAKIEVPQLVSHPRPHHAIYLLIRVVSGSRCHLPLLELGVHITGAHITGEDVTVIEATPREPLGFCPDCGAEGQLRDHVIRHLTDVPITGHPTRLHVRLPRYQCVHAQCRRTIFQHQLDAAEPGAKTTNRATTWILKRLIHDQMSISTISRALGLGWDLVNHLATNCSEVAGLRPS